MTTNLVICVQGTSKSGITFTLPVEVPEVTMKTFVATCPGIPDDIFTRHIYVNDQRVTMENGYVNGRGMVSIFGDIIESAYFDDLMGFTRGYVMAQAIGNITKDLMSLIKAHDTEDSDDE
jgi:hypothetical protein